MDKRKRKTMLIIFGCIAAVLLAGIFVTKGSRPPTESIQTVMRDAVLHDVNRINFFGFDSSPGLVSAYVTTAIITVAAIILRLFFIPRFKTIPGRLQSALEWVVGAFDRMSEGEHEKNANSGDGADSLPVRRTSNLLGAYIFAAGTYIFIGTLMELFGLQAVAPNGNPVSLPAPLSDINGAIMMGCTSYLFIMLGGIINNGPRGVLLTVKEYSLPISMSFRLFGALLSGALVTELVYYYTGLSFVLPVLVSVMFTCLHALIQAYVLTMLVSLFFGEVSQPKARRLEAK